MDEYKKLSEKPVKINNYSTEWNGRKRFSESTYVEKLDLRLMENEEKAM